jgi:hypothetical protein
MAAVRAGTPEERHGQQRTNSRPVTLLRSFTLRGVNGMQPPGTYTVETEEKLIEGLSFPAYRREATVMLLPALNPARNGSRQIATNRPAGAAGGTGAGRKGQLGRRSWHPIPARDRIAVPAAAHRLRSLPRSPLLE